MSNWPSGDVIGLCIFIAIAVGGCIFLMYVLVALLREAHNGKRPPALKPKLPITIRRKQSGKLIRLETTDIFREKTGSERR